MVYYVPWYVHVYHGTRVRTMVHHGMPYHLVRTWYMWYTGRYVYVHVYKYNIISKTT